jgi:hypothetical protein
VEEDISTLLKQDTKLCVYVVNQLRYVWLSFYQTYGLSCFFDKFNRRIKLEKKKFTLIYYKDLKTLKKIAISPCLNAEQIFEMWYHYPHAIDVRSVIKNHIKHTKALPYAQVVNLIETDITEIQNLIKEMFNQNRIILTGKLLTGKMVEAIIKAEKIIDCKLIDSNLKNKILSNSKTKSAYLRFEL